MKRTSALLTLLTLAVGIVIGIGLGRPTSEAAGGKVTDPNGVAPDRYVYYPGTEALAPDEMRIIACGTGMPAARRGQAASCWVFELGNGNLLVTVGSGTNQDAIAEFDTSGNYLGNFVANGDGGLDSPFDILLTSEALVGGITSDIIHRYNVTTGAYIADLAPIDNFPEQIAAAQFSTNLLVANFGGTQEGIVELMSDGTLVGVTDPASLGGYRGVFELGNGNLLVTNGGGVHEIDRMNNLIETKAGGISARFITLTSSQRKRPSSPVTRTREAAPAWNALAGSTHSGTWIS